MSDGSGHYFGIFVDREHWWFVMVIGIVHWFCWMADTLFEPHPFTWLIRKLHHNQITCRGTIRFGLRLRIILWSRKWYQTHFLRIFKYPTVWIHPDMVIKPFLSCKLIPTVTASDERLLSTWACWKLHMLLQFMFWEEVLMTYGASQSIILGTFWHDIRNGWMSRGQGNIETIHYNDHEGYNSLWFMERRCNWCSNLGGNTKEKQDWNFKFCAGAIWKYDWMQKTCNIPLNMVCLLYSAREKA